VGIRSELVFCSQKRGTDHFTENTLISNDIHPRQLVPSPDFVTEILAKLKAKRVITTSKQVWLPLWHFHLYFDSPRIECAPGVWNWARHHCRALQFRSWNDSHCSDKEVTYLLSLYIEKIRHLSLEKDAVKYIIGNCYILPTYCSTLLWSLSQPRGLQAVYVLFRFTSRYWLHANDTPNRWHRWQFHDSSMTSFIWIWVGSCPRHDSEAGGVTHQMWAGSCPRHDSEAGAWHKCQMRLSMNCCS